MAASHPSRVETQSDGEPYATKEARTVRRGEQPQSLRGGGAPTLRAPCGVSRRSRRDPAVQTVMDYPNSLTSAWQQDETSKEAGDNSMAVKPTCGDPDISESRRQGEEHTTKARLPEPQTDTGGSHPLPTPDKGQHSHGARSLCCACANSHGNGADSMSDNGRTGRLRARDHDYLHTTGSPKQGATPAWRRSLHSTQGAGPTPGAASPETALDAGAVQPPSNRGESHRPRGKGDSQKPKKNV